VTGQPVDSEEVCHGCVSAESLAETVNQHAQLVAHPFKSKATAIRNERRKHARSS